MIERTHHNYCVRFDDWSVKTGITKQPFYRLQDYLQEARRHGKRVVRYLITPPAAKDVALAVESYVCSECADDAIYGHREWFRFSGTPGIGPHGDKEPEWFAGLPFDCMQVEWRRRNEHTLSMAKTRELIASIRERRHRRPPLDESYADVIAFAAELASAQRISARAATDVAREMVRLA